MLRVIIAFLLILHSTYGDTLQRPTSCATSSLIATLESKNCASVTSSEADLATAHALHCILKHVGIHPPRCLNTRFAIYCLSTVTPDMYEMYIQLRKRWGMLCAGATAHKLLGEVMEVMETVKKKQDGGEREIGVGVREATQAAVKVLEANLDAFAGVVGLRKVVTEVGEIENGVERIGKKVEGITEEWREVERGRDEIRKVVERVRESAEIGLKEREEVEKGYGWIWGDCMLLGAAVFGGRGMGRLLILVTVGVLWSMIWFELGWDWAWVLECVARGIGVVVGLSFLRNIGGLRRVCSVEELGVCGNKGSRLMRTFAEDESKVYHSDEET